MLRMEYGFVTIENRLFWWSNPLHGTRVNWLFPPADHLRGMPGVGVRRGAFLLGLDDPNPDQSNRARAPKSYHLNRRVSMRPLYPATR